MPVLRFAVADVMTSESCVACHNTHPNSPKKDWKLGDVRGAAAGGHPRGTAAGGRRAGRGALGSPASTSARGLLCLLGVVAFLSERTHLPACASHGQGGGGGCSGRRREPDHRLRLQGRDRRQDWKLRRGPGRNVQGLVAETGRLTAAAREGPAGRTRRRLGLPRHLRRTHWRRQRHPRRRAGAGRSHRRRLATPGRGRSGRPRRRRLPGRPRPHSGRLQHRRSVHGRRRRPHRTQRPTPRRLLRRTGRRQPPA